MNNLLLKENISLDNPHESTLGLMFQNDKYFTNKEVIYAQNDKATYLYRVKRGMVKMIKINENGDQIIKDILVEGEIFGEWESLINPDYHYKTMVISMDSNTIISSIRLNQLNEQIRQKAFISLSPIFLDRKNKQENRFENLLKRDSTYRVKKQLTYLGKKAGRRVGDETLLKISLSHKDLASFTDTSRQTVTTILNEMRKEGKIYYTRDRILFRDLENLLTK
jgi:CRP/FNR family transcriptional regulator